MPLPRYAQHWQKFHIPVNRLITAQGDFLVAATQVLHSLAICHPFGAQQVMTTCYYNPMAKHSVIRR